MNLLSRSEELVLLAIWKLKEEAYGVPIRELLTKWTGNEWAFGAIYKPLKQLVHKDLVQKYTSEPTTERGGRSKYIYELTPKGQEALKDMRKIQETVWESKSKIVLG